MQAGSLEIELFASVARLTQDMAKVEQTVSGTMARVEKSAQTAMRALGAIGAGISVAAFASVIKGAIDAADALNKLQQRTGTTTEFLSQMQYAANMAGIANESLGTAMRKLNQSIASGLAGDKEKLFIFKQLGVTTADLGKGTEHVMMKMADAYAKARDGAGKQAISLALMGKAGDEMIPLLNGGSEAVRELMKEADRLGLTVSRDFGRASEEFNDNLERVRKSSQGAAIALGNDLVKGIGEAMKAMAEATVEGGKLAGVVAGLQTLLTGNDRHKAERAVVEKTEEYLKLQAEIDTMRAAKIPEVVANRLKVFEAEQGRVKAALDLHRGYLRALDAQEDAAKKAADAIKKARDEGKTFKVPDSASAAAAKAEADAAFREAMKIAQARQKLRNEEYADADKHAKALTEAELKMIATIAEERAKLAQAADDAERSALVAVESRVVQLNAEIAGYGLLQSQIEATKLVRLEEQRVAAAAGAERLESLDQQIDAQRRLIGALKQKEQLDEYRAMWQSIDQTAHDVFVNIFEGGSNVFKKLGQTLKAAVLDLLYQMTVKKWIISIGASMGFGLPAMAGQAAGALGGGASALGSLGGIGGFLGNAGTGIMNGLSAWGSGGSVMGMLSNPGLYTGMELLGAAMPILGGVALIASLLSGHGETRVGGQYENGRLVAAPSGGELSAGLKEATATADAINAILAGLGSSQRISNFYAGAEQSEKGKGFAYAGGTLNTFLPGGGPTTFGQGFDGQGYMNRRGSMTAEQATAAYGEELLQATLQALQAATDLPKRVSDMLAGKDFDAMSKESLQETLSGVSAIATSISQFRAALDLLPSPFAQLKNLTLDLTDSLIEQMGGVEAALANMQGYFRNYYSEQEQRIEMAKTIQRRLAAGGLNYSVDEILGSNRAAARAIVEQYDGRTDEAAVKAFAALMSVQELFAELHPIVEQVTDSFGGITPVVETLTDAIKEAIRVQEEYVRDLSSAGGGIASFIRELTAKRGGTASPLDLLNSTRGFYMQDLSGARNGSVEASRRISDSARAYIDAQVGYGASGAQTQAVISQVLAELNSLPAVQTYEQQMLAEARTQAQLLAAIERNTGATVGVLAGGASGPGVSFGAVPTGGSNLPAGYVMSSVGSFDLAGYALANKGDPAGVAMIMKQYGVGQQWLADATGIGIEEIKHVFALGGVTPFANGGYHDGGLRLVGERGWEIEATGPSRIWNQDQLRGALGGGGGEEVLNELRRMNAVLASYAQRDLQNGEVLAQAARDESNARTRALVAV